MDPLQSLTDTELRNLAAALAAGRLGIDTSSLAVSRYVAQAHAPVVADRLAELASLGFQPHQLVILAEAILETRLTRPPFDDRVELVWTGPQGVAGRSRDTAVVIREWFARARKSVLVSCFAVFQGRELFRGLAEQMIAVPSLAVSIFLDIHLAGQEDVERDEVIGRFTRRFLEHDWPNGFPLPDLYFDPRSLRPNRTERASLHAKCVVIDRQVAIVTSANFTEAAQERNVEAGALIHSPTFAIGLAEQFEGLVRSGAVSKLEVKRSP